MMLRRTWDFLYGSEAVEFASDYPVPEAVSRLGQGVSSPWIFFPTHPCALGQVSAQRVSLYHHRPMYRSAFTPRFRGQFHDKGGRAVLRGEYALPVATRLFMTIWFAFLLYFALRVAWVHGDTRAGIGMMVAALAIFAGGVLLVGIGQWIGRRDRIWLDAYIRERLGFPA